MNTLELYQHQFSVGYDMFSAMINDLSDDEMRFTPVEGGNIPLWIVGHLTYSEAFMLQVRIKGGPNPLPEWEGLFARGTMPVPGGAGYPLRAELWAAFRQRRRDLLEYISGLSEADLDRPLPTAPHPYFATVGKALGMLAVHQAFHCGQVADIRKHLGKERVFA